MDWSDTVTERCMGGTQMAFEANVSRLAVHRHTFVVTSGPDQGAKWSVQAPTVHIGTAPTNDLRLTDDTVSRQHCEITVRQDQYLLRDLGSTNGTSLDGVWVLEALLAPGARIRLGQTELHYAAERSWLPVGDSSADHFGELCGHSESMRNVFGLLEKVVTTELSVLITGETGTGKDLAARALHDGSRRASGPFVVVDCGALNRNLVESELFGHERGAFTGAERSRPGAFERAHGGTIFLDEIGELPLDLQPKLLRVLERREVRRLGAGEPMDVDVRIVAATHRDLPVLVHSGQFREDLFYRLSELVVRLPPLRERRKDIPLLAARLIEQARGEGSRPRLSADALEYLAARHWPGNVRELRNMMRRAAALAEDTSIGRTVLEQLDQMAPAAALDDGPGEREMGVVDVADNLPIRKAREQWINTLERDYLQRVMQRFGEDVDGAAEHMGLHRKSVYRLLRQHGLME